MTRPEVTVPHEPPAPLPLWTVPLRIAVVIGVTVAALLLLIALSGSSDPTGYGTLLTRILGGLALSVLVAISIIVLVRRVERRSLRVVGLTSAAGDLRAFALGVAAWTLPAAVTFLVLALLGSPLRVTAPAPDFWLVLGLLFLAVLLSEAIPEELLFRGYVTAVLAERLSPWWVIGVQTVLFVATAILLRGDINPLDVSLFAAMGFVLGYVRHVTGSVWTGVGIHVAFQTAAQLVLTQRVIEFGGPPELAMLALGAVPFTAVAILVPTITAWKARD